MTTTGPAVPDELVLRDFAALSAMARDRVGPVAFDYCAGGAGDEGTMERNVAELDAALLCPRMLAAPDVRLATTVPGGELAAPVLVAPMGLQALMDAEAEVATARAAAAAGLGFALSTFSSRPPEDVAAAGPGVRWFQLYALTDRELTRRLLDLAADLGFGAVVCTLDMPVIGRRDRDLRNRFDRFSAAVPALLSRREVRDRIGRDGILSDLFPHSAFGWPDLRALIAGSRLPVLVKGVLHPDDARRALDAGAAGVVVSNHGGRQFERSVTSVSALPGVVAAVGGAAPVFFDSGVRTGRHIAVALALGARAVLVGRPVIMGLGAAGEPGVRAVLDLLVSDLRAVMRVVGARSPDQLTGAGVRIPQTWEALGR